jgi:hypothetical protein
VTEEKRTYSDTDMLLYARLMTQRVRRLQKEGRA